MSVVSVPIILAVMPSVLAEDFTENPNDNPAELIAVVPVQGADLSWNERASATIALRAAFDRSGAFRTLTEPELCGAMANLSTMSLADVERQLTTAQKLLTAGQPELALETLALALDGVHEHGAEICHGPLVADIHGWLGVTMVAMDWRIEALPHLSETLTFQPDWAQARVGELSETAMEAFAEAQDQVASAPPRLEPSMGALKLSSQTSVELVAGAHAVAPGEIQVEIYRWGESWRTAQAPLLSWPPQSDDPGMDEVVRLLRVAADGDATATTEANPFDKPWWFWATVGSVSAGITTAVALSIDKDPEPEPTATTHTYTVEIRAAD